MLFEKPFDDYSLEFRASVDLDESITWAFGPRSSDATSRGPGWPNNTTTQDSQKLKAACALPVFRAE